MSAQPIYIALGGNLPFQGASPQETMVSAMQSLTEHGVTPVEVSSFWSSPAWPDPSKPEYINAVASVSTELDENGLLMAMQAIESVFGRERSARWASRTLDLDIIDFKGAVRDSQLLTLPHPRAAERAFVLLPLQEIAPDWHHPVTGVPIAELIERLDAADAGALRRLA